MNYNKNFDKLENEYIFSKIRQSASAFKKTDYELIDLGVGDVKLPLFEETVSAMKNACQEMQEEKTFKGYPPANGYQFLRDKISSHYFSIGADVFSDEIFITDGAKGQLGNITELFSFGIDVLFQSPRRFCRRKPADRALHPSSAPVKNNFFRFIIIEITPDINKKASACRFQNPRTFLAYPPFLR